MSLVTPLVIYKSIKINNTDILLGSECRASFISPYNSINVTMIPSNCSLSYYEVRVTGVDDEYDIGVGNKAYWNTNIAAELDHTFTIDINRDNFNLGDGKYRISMYARSSLDDSWDVTYLFFTVSGDQFILADGAAFEVSTNKNIN